MRRVTLLSRENGLAEQVWSELAKFYPPSPGFDTLLGVDIGYPVELGRLGVGLVGKASVKKLDLSSLTKIRSF